MGTVAAVTVAARAEAETVAETVEANPPVAVTVAAGSAAAVSVTAVAPGWDSR